MRFKKKCCESCSFNELGEKSIELSYDAEIILTLEEVQEMLSAANSVNAPIFKDLEETYLQAKKSILFKQM